MTQKSQNLEKKFYCIKCDYSTFNKTDFNKHLRTLKHKNDKWITQKSQNFENKYLCKLCNFAACNNIDFYNHLKNCKKNSENCNDKKSQKSQDDNGNKVIESIYECECGKKYKYKQGLYKHKLKCKKLNKEVNIVDNSSNINENKSIISDEVIIKLLKENNEIKNTLIQENVDLRNQIKELIPKVGTNIKQKFNINVFLNEQCKDALNINEFINSIQISLEQLDYTKNNGIENGISNVLIENINKLSIYERPLHCTDTKRETLYIKSNDSWEKDNSKEKIKNVINNLSTKNYNALNKWIDENPDYENDINKQEYFTKTLSTLGKNNKTDEKIIKNLCNKFTIKEIINND